MKARDYLLFGAAGIALYWAFTKGAAAGDVSILNIGSTQSIPTGQSDPVVAQVEEIHYQRTNEFNETPTLLPGYFPLWGFVNVNNQSKANEVTMNLVGAQTASYTTNFYKPLDGLTNSNIMGANPVAKNIITGTLR